jgi:hypothetical protein
MVMEALSVRSIQMKSGKFPAAIWRQLAQTGRPFS